MEKLKQNIGQTRGTADNTVLPKWRQKCYYETFVLNSTAVFLLNFSANNPPLRQYPKRYAQYYNDNETDDFNIDFCFDDIFMFRTKTTFGTCKGL
ncbi:MAG: hypothetical protein D8M26_10750 [Ignavibacteriae bacterium]|nr:hypothetical protein [Ignavibacteriota bacterium]MCZ7615208.1 hypothetical protein [Ignavibacteriaceae bacterium]